MEDYYDVLKKIPPTTPTGHIPLPTVTATPPQFEHITGFGHKTLWVVFALMLLSSLAFILLSWRVVIPKRMFYQLTTFTAIISTFAYYAMATHSGFSFHHIWVTDEHKHDLPETHKIVMRQIFWARFVDWLLTTPLILFNLGALAGLSGSNILNLIFANWAVIFTGLFGAYGHGRSKWGWYAMSWVAFLFVGWQLFRNGRITAQKRGVQKLYGPLMSLAVGLWAVYLIIWGVGDMARKLTPDQEVVIFAVLDFLAKPVFGFWLLLNQKNVNASNVTVDGVWAEGFGQREGVLRVGDEEDA